MFETMFKTVLTTRTLSLPRIVAALALAFALSLGACSSLPSEVRNELSGAKMTIQFESGSAPLAGDSKVTLDRTAELLKQYTDLSLAVHGYTDNAGASAANEKLSQRRADAVKDYLVDAGVDASRIASIGHGEADPVASNATSEGRAQNRRIEFHID